MIPIARLTVGAKGSSHSAWVFTGVGDLPPLTINLMLVTHLVAQTQVSPDSWSTCITKVSPAKWGEGEKCRLSDFTRNTFNLATESHRSLGLRKENLHTQKTQLTSHQGASVLMASQKLWFQ